MITKNGDSKVQTNVSVNGNVITPTASTLTGDIGAGDVLDGKFGYAADPDTKIEGTMPNNAAADVEVTTTSGTTISAGYYNGSGAAKLSAAEAAKVLEGNIKDGVTLLGVAGTYDPEYVTSIFLEDGTFVVPAGVTSLDAFIVGGGGSGAGDYGGGGGGYTDTFLEISSTPAGSLSVVVGAGGAGGFPGENGSKSWFHTEGTYYANGGSLGNESGEAGGGAGGSGGSGTGGDAGGSDGSNGVGTYAGTGQGTTTRMFEKTLGQLYAGGGGGAGAGAGGAGGGGDPSHHDGYDGLGGGGMGGVAGNGGSGIVILRYLAST